MTAAAVTALLIAAKVTIVGLGGAITYFAYRAFRRTRSTALRSFAIGFGIITFGGVLGGGLDYLGGIGLRRAVLIQSLLTAVGLAVLFRSLYQDGPIPNQ